MTLSMKMARPLVGTAVVVLLAVVACGDSLPAKTLHQQLKKKKAAPIVIDVRSAVEYRQGHVPGAIHIPFWAVAFKRAALPPQTGSVVVYCEAGPRAVLARGLLLLVGVRPVVYLKGHMSAWRRSGLPMEKGQ
ncbi:MAG: rhodanese-like domain-containing protein [Desulfuromonas sp.]|nr:rhodanese-like domain-containing protein [Desulfuromonas sp.]